ncbi:STAS domain-containing protein [Actinoplanes sp. DH11]|uniref:STAS domain-containing protein n=1 Tax=Actinoplanes sp. DH11 TaxID=2857011 RepID=UPI001E2B6310|nr:STAS domain-containing protein [Actinoplanes sp. DH11]
MPQGVPHGEPWVPGASVRLTVTGEIDMATVEPLAASLRELLARRDLAEVLVDLAEVVFCDASGVRALSEAYARANTAGIRMRVLNARGITRRVLEITGTPID